MSAYDAADRRRREPAAPPVGVPAPVARSRLTARRRSPRRAVARPVVRPGDGRVDVWVRSEPRDHHRPAHDAPGAAVTGLTEGVVAPAADDTGRGEAAGARVRDGERRQPAIGVVGSSLAVAGWRTSPTIDGGNVAVSNDPLRPQQTPPPPLTTAQLDDQPGETDAAPVNDVVPSVVTAPATPRFATVASSPRMELESRPSTRRHRLRGSRRRSGAPRRSPCTAERLLRGVDDRDGDVTARLGLPVAELEVRVRSQHHTPSLTRAQLVLPPTAIDETFSSGPPSVTTSTGTPPAELSGPSPSSPDSSTPQHGPHRP